MKSISAFGKQILDLLSLSAEVGGFEKKLIAKSSRSSPAKLYNPQCPQSDFGSPAGVRMRARERSRSPRNRLRSPKLMVSNVDIAAKNAQADLEMLEFKCAIKIQSVFRGKRYS